LLLEPLTQADRDLFQSFAQIAKGHHEAIHKSFACSIMDLADDISFGVHDMEDVLALELVNEEQFRSRVPADQCQGLLDYRDSKYPGKYGNDVYEGLIKHLFGDGHVRKHQINCILNFVIPSVEVTEIEGFSESRLRYRAKLPDQVMIFVKALNNFIRSEVIFGPSVQHLEFKGQMMVIAVFEVMKSDPESFLPSDIYRSCEGSADPVRVICDYVAGMTEPHLLRTYERLFAPRMGSVFDKL
jgi:dGTPase